MFFDGAPMSKSIKVISFAGNRPEMDEYFLLLKKQGYKYVADLANPYLRKNTKEASTVTV